MPAVAPLLRPVPPEPAAAVVLGDEVAVDEVDVGLLVVADDCVNPTVVAARASFSSLNDWLFAPWPAPVPGRRSNQQSVAEVKFRSSSTEPLYGAAGRESTELGVSEVRTGG